MKTVFFNLRRLLHKNSFFGECYLSAVQYFCSLKYSKYDAYFLHNTDGHGYLNIVLVNNNCDHIWLRAKERSRIKSWAEMGRSLDPRNIANLATQTGKKSWNEEE